MWHVLPALLAGIQQPLAVQHAQRVLLAATPMEQPARHVL
jgi:hypothetical protein